MGNLLTKPKLFLAALYQLLRTYRILEERLARSPGLPVPRPTRSFWMVPPADVHGDAFGEDSYEKIASAETDSGEHERHWEALPGETCPFGFRFRYAPQMLQKFLFITFGVLISASIPKFSKGILQYAGLRFQSDTVKDVTELV